MSADNVRRRTFKEKRGKPPRKVEVEVQEVLCDLCEGWVVCYDYTEYERNGKTFLCCTKHQPLAEIDSTGSLKHTEALLVLKGKLGLKWKEIDKPEAP